jgi:hypothetical protein
MAKNFEWADARTWPSDAPNQIFLARAVNRVGQYVFSEWRDADPLARPLTPSNDRLPSFLEDARWQHRDRAWRLIAERHPERPRPSPIFGSSKMRPLLDLSQEDWKLACDIEAEKLVERQKAREPETAAHNRYVGVKEFIRENCAWKKLGAYVQSGDGEFHPLKPSLWNTDRFEEWFRSGKLSAVDAFGGWNTDTAPKYWLFFSADTLESLTGPKPDQAALSTTAGRRGFKERLIALMLASPNRRTISKDEQIAIGTSDEYKLSARDASGVRDQALREVPDVVRKAWSRHGPTVSSVSS